MANFKRTAAFMVAAVGASAGAQAALINSAPTNTDTLLHGLHQDIFAATPDFTPGDYSTVKVIELGTGANLKPYNFRLVSDPSHTRVVGVSANGHVYGFNSASNTPFVVTDAAPGRIATNDKGEVLAFLKSDDGRMKFVVLRNKTVAADFTIPVAAGAVAAIANAALDKKSSNPVPEPAAVAVLGMGLVGLARQRRRSVLGL